MNEQPPIIRLPLGSIAATPGADQLLKQHNHSSLWYIARHQCGDWGHVSPDDAKANEEALLSCARVLSSFTVEGSRLWIITEADRSVTTLLLPEEY